MVGARPCRLLLSFSLFIIEKFVPVVLDSKGRTGVDGEGGGAGGAHLLFFRFLFLPFVYGDGESEDAEHPALHPLSFFLFPVGVGGHRWRYFKRGRKGRKWRGVRPLLLFLFSSQ